MALRFRSIHRQTLNHSTLQVQSVLNGALGLSSSLLPLQSRVTSVSPTTRTARRSFATIAANTDRVRRRKRPNFGKLKFEGTGPPKILFEQKGLDEPFSYGGEDGTSADEYLNKTSLSPWVPIPDPIARKLFDMSAPTPEDIHVELGCGDGRVNFYAIDHGKVKKSTGIDIDDGILDKARERLGKRYPQPPIEFITADLLDYNHEAWEKVQEATIITMYFVEDALQKIRPLLEEKLAGKRCKIITCAYEMKGWTHTIMETTLGTTVYLYEWGTDMQEEDTSFFAEDDLLLNKPKEFMEDPLQEMRANGENMNIEHIEKIMSMIPDMSKPDPNDSWSDDEDEDMELEMEQNMTRQKAAHNPSKLNLAEAHKKSGDCSSENDKK